MVVWGALQAVATVFNTADASMGLMATINLDRDRGAVGDGGEADARLFRAARRRGSSRAFHGRDYPELGDQIDHTIWTARLSAGAPCGRG